MVVLDRTGVAARHRAGAAGRNSRTRADIQVLRAAAVSMVVVYHLVPGRLSGGFVGVDVFFVISGFLITSHLIAHPPATVADLLTFWGRRIRRLLPAALSVLAVTLVASWLWLPETEWTDTGRQVFAAAAYFVNWRLADDAVDYLHASVPPTPVQHFWSLSVEEQFYLGWPVLVLLLTYLAWRRSRRTVVYGLGITAVVVVSLLYSIHETAQNPAAAYFVTPTRIWELACGGLVAVVAPRLAAIRLPGLRTSAAYLGWLLVVAVAFGFSDATPFPSWRAALPVAGTMLVIAAAADIDWYEVAVLQKLGGISYSLYLWHWPLIVLVPAALDSRRGRYDDIAILAAALLLATLTKVYVEDPVRRRGWWQRLVPTYALGALAMAVVLALALGMTGYEQHRQNSDQARLAGQLASGNPCLGAGALDPARNCTPGQIPDGMVPAPAAARSDAGFLWKPWDKDGDCSSNGPKFPLVTCRTEDTAAQRDVAIVGNSHGAQWGAAIDQITSSRGWRIDTYYAHHCPSLLVSGADPDQDGCAGWGARVVEELVRTKPDLVVISNITSAAEQRDAGMSVLSTEQQADAYGRLLAALSAADIPVLVIRDAPSGFVHGTRDRMPDCLAQNTANPDRCFGYRKDLLPSDAAVTAVAQLHDPHVTSVDLSDYFCQADRCQAVVGGVTVYADGGHITQTYARTLAPYLAPAVLRAIG